MQFSLQVFFLMRRNVFAVALYLLKSNVIFILCYLCSILIKEITKQIQKTVENK